jgi:hypothetical protein
MSYELTPSHKFTTTKIVSLEAYSPKFIDSQPDMPPVWLPSAQSEFTVGLTKS